MNDLYNLSKINEKKYPIFANIKNQLIQYDKCLQEKKFKTLFSNLERDIQLCERFRNIAIKNNDEYCANCSYLLKENFYMTHSIANFWKLCEEFDYNQAWASLQDALDQNRSILKYLEKDVAEYMVKSLEYLTLIEKLFPYCLFNSLAIDGVEVECSICRKSPFNQACIHEAGGLYWGEMAINRVIKIGSIHHNAMVPHPADKRCITFIEFDKNNPEQSPFKQIFLFICHSRRPFNPYQLKMSEKEIPRPNFNHIPKKWPCPCGSGISFEKCCFNKDVIIIPHYDFIFQN